MIPGPDRFIYCPHCAALSRVFSLVSGNTLGATFWSDGFMFAPMLPQPPTITSCHSCHGVFWVADADKTLDTPPASVSATVPMIEELTEEQCLDAIEAGLATTRERERELRTLAWWRANDPYRWRKPDEPERAEIPRSARQRENLRRLFELLNGSDSGDLLRAELAREDRQFDRALEILDDVKGDPSTEPWEHRVVREQLSELSRSRLPHPCVMKFEAIRAREERGRLAAILRRFIDEFCLDDPGANLKVFDFTVALEAWARERGVDFEGCHSRASRPRLHEILRELGIEIDGELLKGLRCSYSNKEIDDWRKAWADWSRRQDR